MGWHDGYGYGYAGTSIGMVLMMMLFWLPLIGLGIWLVARATRPRPMLPTRPEADLAHMPPAADSARGILDRRFAAGEIDAAKYTEMRRVLESGAGK